MTTLRPMEPGTYASWLEAAILGYARENVAVGRWPEAGATDRAREDFLSLLPDGPGTPDHYLFEVLSGPDATPVGAIWYALIRRAGTCQAFIYDIEILAPHRRLGHARRAIEAVERHAFALGATSVGLNVFAHNLAAQGLYRQLGYMPTNFNMSRPLPRP